MYQINNHRYLLQHPPSQVLQPASLCEKTSHDPVLSPAQLLHTPAVRDAGPCQGALTLYLYSRLPSLLLQDPLPVCDRSRMQKIMPMMREMSQRFPDCPLACLEEQIHTDISFTLFSDQTFNTAWTMWNLPANRTKEDSVWMEIYYSSLTTQVTKFQPAHILDILSTIGGTIGLFLGGSLFSIIETLAIVGLLFVSVSKNFVVFFKSNNK